VASILEAFGDIIVDFIKDSDDSEYCFTYISAIISFYKLHKKEKDEVVDVVLNYLSNLNDYCLDNKNLVNIWVNILHLVINYKIFYWSDFDRLNDLSDEQYTFVYDIVCKTVQKFKTTDQNKIFSEMNKLNFFKAKEAIFKAIRKNNS